MELLALTLHILDGGTQRGTQQVKFLLHGWLLAHQRLDFLLSVLVVLQFPSRLDSGIPVGDQLTLLQKYRFLGTGLLLSEVVFLISQVFLVLGFVIQPLQHLLCPIDLS